MTASSAHQATSRGRLVEGAEPPPRLDYSKVHAYWEGARPSILGPYMMDGFGFPAGAGNFRFCHEIDTVAEAIRDLGPDASVLDLGSGVGVWTEFFAQRFAKVVSVEASSALYEALEARCASYPNVTTFQRDVLSFDPAVESGSTGGFGLVFLGGLLMYLNDRDVRALLRKIIPYLEPGGLVLCRESTIRSGVRTLQGEYQVVYRSVDTYRSMLVDAGYDIVSTKANTAYINVQMACEIIKKWKAMVPERFHCLPVIGRLTYWAVRLGHPLSTRLIPGLATKMGCEFPSLMNNFFVLRPRARADADRRDSLLHEPRMSEQMFENAR